MDNGHHGTVHIGTSGWSYDHWENVLYPPGLPARERLAHYAARFTTVELNASFYRWPRDTSFASWRRRLPPGFLLSVKAPRGLTHGKKLYAPEVWIERIARCWHELGEKRAVLLVQLPPDFARDDARLEYFLAALPDWIRVSVEFRHPSWDAPEVYALLERHGAAYCVMSGAGLPCVLRATAGVRLRPAARPGPGAPLRRLLLGRRASLVGGPDPRMAGGRQGGLCVFQQRRRR